MRRLIEVISLTRSLVLLVAVLAALLLFSWVCNRLTSPWAASPA